MFAFPIVIVLVYPQTRAGAEVKVLTCLAMIQNPDEVIFRIFDITWCVAFVLELVLRIFADGKMFFSIRNPECLAVFGVLNESNCCACPPCQLGFSSKSLSGTQFAHRW